MCTPLKYILEILYDVCSPTPQSHVLMNVLQILSQDFAVHNRNVCWDPT
jgi:hypothetical protein